MADQLEELKKRIIELAKDLPDQYAPLRKSSLGFAKGITDLKIPDLLRKANEYGQGLNGTKAYENADLALQRMKKLAGQCSNNAFGGMMSNQILFNIPKSIKCTLQQMMDSMFMGQQNEGKGSGQGTGSGLDMNDGYFGESYSPLNVPIMGPERTELGKKRPQGVMETDKKKKGRGIRGKTISKDSTEQMNIQSRKVTKTKSLSWDSVPDKYREAVKKYFSE